jgi:hypothetical protein
MTKRKRITFWLTLAAAALALALVGAVGASAHDGHGGDDGSGNGNDNDGAKALFTSALAPSHPDDPAIHGVAPGAVPWVLDRGKVRIGTDGSIRVKLQGLVIPIAHGTFPAGTARPVTVVSASLYCAPDSAAAAATTKSVPISEDGDATIADRVSLPSTCLAPIVLVHPNDSAGAYIAATGWRG